MRFIGPALLIAVFLVTPAHAYSVTEFRQDDQRTQDIYRKGDIAGALAAAQVVYDKAVAAFGPDDFNTAEAGVTLSNMMRETGDYDGALAFMDQLYASVDAAYAPNTPIHMKITAAYASLLSDMGQADKALPLQIAALAEIEALHGQDSDPALIFSFNLAKTYEVLGYADQALALYRSIAAAYDRVSSPDNLFQRGTVRIQIARTLYAMRAYPEAVAAYREALPLSGDYWGPNHPQVLAQKLVFGYALWQTGDDRAVESALAEMRAGATLTYGPNSLFHSDVNELEALIFSRGGPSNPRFGQSLTLMAQSIAIKEAQLAPTHNALGRPMLEYAAMLRDTGEYGQAATLAIRAEKAGYASRDVLIETLAGAVNAGQMDYDSAMAELFRVVQKSSSSQAGYAGLQLAARIAMDNSEDAARFRQVTDSAQRQTTLEAQLLEASTKPLAERDRAAEATLRQAIADNAAARNAAETALDATHPQVADLIGGGVLSLPEVQALLGPEGALVVVDFGADPNSPGLAMSVTEAGVGYALLPFAEESYAAAVADIRASISLTLGVRGAVALDDAAPAPRRGFPFAAARWLYATTIEQAFAINGKRKHLYVDLRGPMASIPPHLLLTAPVDDDVTDQTAPWLVRDFNITVLPSVFSLKLAGLARPATQPKRPLLGFADPVYTQTGADLTLAAGQSLRATLTPLPETADEVLQVALALDAGTDSERLGPMASEAGVKAADLSDYGVLYFATHGLVAGDVVGASVLGEPALALTGGQGEDGLLTASEIAQLRLNADLVVLSACNTAVGDQPGDQALSGLARAFTYAGARSLIVSHWPVESRSAVAMMTDIFDRRAANPKLTAAQAQREAILSMIEAPRNVKWSDPAYWAPFVLVGNSD